MHDGRAGESPEPYDVAATFKDVTQAKEQKALVRRWLDGGYRSAGAFWAHVEKTRGLEIERVDAQDSKWMFVADPVEVAKILNNDSEYLVSEYDKRMSATSGRFYLGMDGDEHSQDADLGAIIPSWNAPNRPRTPNTEQLAKVTEIAERACRTALALNGGLSVIAKQLDNDARCRLALPLIIGPVLDSCALAFFGLKGPSLLSLLSWAKDITFYHFRAYAEHSDYAVARDASGQFRSHVLAQLGALKDMPAQHPLHATRNNLSKILQKNARKTPGSDGDIARNLMGILTGSLTATYKAVSDALAIRANKDIWGDPSQDNPSAEYPLYERIIATTLATQRRGSLDAVYRTYQGEQPAKVGKLTIHKGDLVVVWLGGTLEKTDSQDNLYGIGVHKCPGIDMAKAILEGALRVLTKLNGANAPQVEMEGETLYLVFPNPKALLALDQNIQAELEPQA